jgi:hypothetical protein
LAVLAATAVVLAGGLFVYFSLSLRSATADMRTETARLSQ